MIRLEPFTPADFPRLIQWSGSPDFLLQWAGSRFQYPLDEPQLVQHLKGNEGPEPERLNFKAVDGERGEMVGHIELNRIDPVNRSATVSRVLLDPALRGGGWGTAMVREATRYGFEELGLRRLQLHVFDFNHSAIRCYERVGFQLEGTLREECKAAGDTYWNKCIMGLLKREWMEKESSPKI